MPARIDAQFVQPPVNTSIVTVLQPLEICAHLVSLPGRVAGKLRDLIPIRIMGIDQDHGIVGGATAESACPRIQHSVNPTAIPLLPVLRVLALAHIVAVVAYEEIPFHRVVLRSEWMKARNVIVLWKPVGGWVEWISAAKIPGVPTRFHQQYGVAGLRKP